MLKIVNFLDYDANYAYAPPHSPAVINMEEIVRVVLIPRKNTRSSYDITRFWFKNGSHMGIIGRPEDLVQDE